MAVKNVVAKVWSLTAEVGYRDTNPDYGSTPPDVDADITVNPSLTATATIKNTVAAGITAILGHASYGTAPLVLEIQSPTPGVLYEYQEGIRLASTMNPGSWANKVTIRVRSGDTVQFRAADRSAGDRYGILADGCKYVKISGGSTLGTYGFILDRRSDWAAPDGDSFFHDKQFYITNGAQYLIFEGIDFPGANDYEMSFGERDTYDLKFYNCRGELGGINANNSYDGNDHGEILQLCSQRVLIDQCRFARGGHDCLSLYGPFQILRNSYLDQDWTDYATASAIGARPVAASPNARKSWVPVVDTSLVGPLLIENNEFRNIDLGDEPEQHMVCKVEGVGIIIRNNWTFGNNGRCHLIGQLFGTQSMTIFCSGDNTIYHNTYKDMQGFVRYDEYYGETNPAVMSRENGRRFLINNNVCARMKEGEFAPAASRAPQISWGAGYSLSGTSYANWWRDSVIRDNCFDLVSGASQAVYHANGSTTLTNSTAYPLNFYDNQVGTVTFLDETADTKAGLALDASSIGYGESTGQTYTTAASSGTSITVAHPFCFLHAAEWFPDADTLSEFGLQSDYIRIETTTGFVTKQIASFDRTTGVIGFSGAITVASGAGVWWAGNPGLGSTGNYLTDQGAMVLS